MLIRLDILLESDPEEVGWRITDLRGEDAIRYFQPGYYSKPGSYAQDFLLESGIYVFVMNDISGSGTGK